MLAVEHMKERAAWVQSRSGQNRGFGRAFGVSESTASHWKAERVQAGPIFQALDALAKEKTTTPAPLLTEMEIVVFERQYADLTLGALVREFKRLRDEEHTDEAQENRTALAFDEEAYGRALRVEAMKQCALAALMSVARMKYGKNQLREAVS